MILDIIDLRQEKWIPKQNDSKPKLICEVENDAKNEAIAQCMSLFSYESNKSQYCQCDNDKQPCGRNQKSFRKYYAMETFVGFCDFK